jgi:hypothetical protein
MQWHPCRSMCRTYKKKDRYPTAPVSSYSSQAHACMTLIGNAGQAPNDHTEQAPRDWTQTFSTASHSRNAFRATAGLVCKSDIFVMIKLTLLSRDWTCPSDVPPLWTAKGLHHQTAQKRASTGQLPSAPPLHDPDKSTFSLAAPTILLPRRFLSWAHSVRNHTLLCVITLTISA